MMSTDLLWILSVQGPRKGDGRKERNEQVGEGEREGAGEGEGEGEGLRREEEGEWEGERPR